MKSTFLILSATVLFSASAAAQQANYSLWPRRPAELEQAQRHIRREEYEQALQLLTPFIHKTGLAGREARRFSAAIRVRRYLSPENPKAITHTIRRGENIERIAAAHKSSSDIVSLINGLTDPSALKAGQKLLVIPMSLRAELHLAEREISVWDGQTLISVYDVIPSQELENGDNEETQLKEEEGEQGGARVPRSSMLFNSCNRTLKLADGIVITAATNKAPKTVRMQQKDVNELSLLLGVGARVSIVRDAKLFDPFPAAEAAEAEKPAANK